MSLLRYALLAATCIIAVADTYAQTPPAADELRGAAVLEGIVRDAETGASLPGAHIRLIRMSATPGSAAGNAAGGQARGAGEQDRGAGDQAEFGAVSDLEGTYRLSVPAGSYLLVATFIGFETFEQRDVSLGDDEVRMLNIRLEPGSVRVNPITITASKRRERILQAPASVTVLEPRQIESRTALTAAEHLTSVPAVDLVHTGLVSSRISVRGFNDALSGRLLTLVDNRIARAPSVRFTALQLIPMTDGDIEQIEVVSGPASALYGPNAANGVVHMITKSPFESQGTQVSLAGGQQNVTLGSFRHAGTSGSSIGYKIAGQYYTGDEFEYFDPREQQARMAALEAGADPDTLRIGARNFDVTNLALNGRLDLRLREHATLSVNAGLTRGDNIEITPTGAAQVENARVGYVQARLEMERFFAQAYGNFLHSGSSYFLRTGETFTDKSKLFVLQLQRWMSFGRHHVTFGTDVFRTLPESERSVTGRNESRDAITEYGGYVQAETALTNRLRLTGAARLDYHDKLDILTFSPRLAAVGRPGSRHTLRATWNLAFETPRPNDLFTDVLGARDLFMLGAFESSFGFAPTTDLRAQGMLDGFHFERTSTGRPRFRSPFAPLDPRGLTETTYIDLNDPTFTNVMWDVARIAAVEGLADGLADSGLLDASEAAAVSTGLDAVLPVDITGVGNELKVLDLDSEAFVPVSAGGSIESGGTNRAGGVADIPPLDVTRTQTFEFGYKGLIGPNIVLGLDIYHTRVKDFQGPFGVGTPNVFLDSGDLLTALRSDLDAALADPSNAEAADKLLALDRLALIGNNNGTAAEEIAFLLSTGIAGSIPFGTVSPVEAFDPTAVVLVRENFGDISVSGMDANVQVFLSRRLRIGLMYSWISDNFFRDVDGVEDIALNAPRHKGGGQFSYETASGDLRVGMRGRFVQGFPVRSDVYVGQVEDFLVLDASVDYRIPFIQDTRLNLSIQNLTDNEHREFVFVPEMGRLAILRLSHTF